MEVLLLKRIFLNLQIESPLQNADKAINEINENISSKEFELSPETGAKGLKDPSSDPFISQQTGKLTLKVFKNKAQRKRLPLDASCPVLEHDSPIVSDNTIKNQGGTSHSNLGDGSMKLAEDPEPVAGPSQLDKNGDTSFVRRSERKTKTVSSFDAGEEDSDDEYDL